jgi:hypothetical protein
MIAAVCFGVSAQAGAERPPEMTVENVVARLTGTFTSEMHADLDPAYKFVVLESCTFVVQPEEGVELPLGLQDAAIVYTEQALADYIDHPYRTRISGVKLEGEHVIVRNYALNLPLPHGLCSIPVEDRIMPAWMIGAERCSMSLTWRGPHYFAESPATGCTGEGVAYTTHFGWLDDDSVRDWSRGYNADGSLVWGPAGGPYIFKRIDPATLVLPPQVIYALDALKKNSECAGH